MTQLTQEQMMAMAAAWQQQNGFNSEKAAANARPATDYWSMKNGTVLFRILPPGLPGNETYAEGFDARRYFKYWIELPNTSPNAQNKSERWNIYDAKKSLPKLFTEDPIGDVLQELAASVPADQLKLFRSKARCLCNIWIKEIYDERNNLIDQANCNKIVVADLPIGFFDFLKSARVNPMMASIFNPYMGLDLMMSREGKGRNDTEYKYGTRPGMVAAPIVNDLDKVNNILKDVKDLAKLVEENCRRDLQNAADVASQLRSHFAEAAKRMAFGAMGMPQQPQGGFAPGPMPGGFAPTAPVAPMQPTAPWGVPQAPMAPQGWPQAPQAPTAPQGWPQQPQTQQSPPGWSPAAPQQPQAPTPPWQPAPPAAPAVQQAPQAPQANPAAPSAPPSMPTCYKQFRALNGMDPAMESNPKNEQCKTCVYKMACVFESPSV